MITADHKVLDEEQEPRLYHTCDVVVQDLATQWIQRNPCKTKSAQDPQRSLRQFSRPEENPRNGQFHGKNESLRRAELES